MRSQVSQVYKIYKDIHAMVTKLQQGVILKAILKFNLVTVIRARWYDVTSLPGH